MAPRPPIQAVIEQQAEFDSGRRNWRMALFNPDHTPFAGGGGGGAEEVADLTFVAGWSNLGGAYEPVRRVKQGRLVSLAGILKSIGSHSGGTVIGTLPEGWRPENILLFGGFGYFASGYGIRRWDIEPNGNIIMQEAVNDNDWMGLHATFLVPA